MLDYIRIINYAKGFGMSGRNIADQLGVSKSGVNDFLRAFGRCSTLSFPLPQGITNQEVYTAVYGSRPGRQADDGFCLPDFRDVSQRLKQPDMTLLFLWNGYRRRCEESGEKAYSYRQFCRLYGKWCGDHALTFHFAASPGESMEVDFAGKTFSLIDPYTREERPITVFVATLPYSQAIYAEGMTSLDEAHWIQVHNNALQYFGGVPALVVPDNCKQAVLVNRDWVEPELNSAYAEWADWNGTYILPAKVRRPTYKASVERSVGILERGIFHDLSSVPFFSLDSFNEALWKKIQEVNDRPMVKRNASRSQLLEEERKALMSLPASPYEYAETRTAKVNSTSHVQFSKAYYSVDYRHANESVMIRATASRVRIYSMNSELLADWPRAERPGEYMTNPEHMPAWYRDMEGTSVTSLVSEASQIGPHTSKFIRQLLEDCAVPVQGFRRCQAILRFARRYGNEVLEKACADALCAGKVNYTFLRNTVAAVAEQSGDCAKHDAHGTANEGVYKADPGKTSLDKLLARSAQLISAAQKGRETHEE